MKAWFIDFRFRRKMALDAGGAAAKHGNGLAVLVRDLDIVNAAASALMARAADDRQCIAEVGRGDEIDVYAGGDRLVVEAVAGIGEVGIGQGEDEAAVTNAVAIDHVLSHFHGAIAPPGVVL
jgi:hypothetical protein